MLKQSEMLRNLSQVLKGTLIIGVTVKQKNPHPSWHTGPAGGSATGRSLHASVRVNLSARCASVPPCSVPEYPGNISSNVCNNVFLSRAPPHHTN